MRTPQTLGTQARGPLSGRRILIVEDVYLLATALQDALQRQGGRVVGPFRALDPAQLAIDREPLDLAMLDVNLAGEAVFPLAEHLDAAGVPLMFVTGCAPDRLPARWRLRPCVTKPVDVAALCAAAERLLCAMPPCTAAGSATATPTRNAPGPWG